MYPMVTLFVVLIVYAYYQWKSTAHKLMLFAAAVALGFSLLLMAYQLRTIGELRYYYFKSNYTYILLATILAAPMIGEIVRQLYNHPPVKNRRLHHQLIGTIVGLLAVIVFWQCKSLAFDDFLHSRMGGVSPAQAQAISDVMFMFTATGETEAINSCAAIS